MKRRNFIGRAAFLLASSTGSLLAKAFSFRDFPWMANIGGHAAPPPAQFAFSPSNSIITWDDTNGGGQQGTLADFNSTADKPTVTKIDFDAVTQNITSVINLANLPALQEFQLNQNCALTALNFSSNANMSTIGLTQCGAISSLNLTGCTALNWLNCDTNQLVSIIGLSTCTALQIFICSNNLFTSLDIGFMGSQIQTFDCSNNSNLTTVTAASLVHTLNDFKAQLCPNLTTLTLTNYNIADGAFDIHGCTALTALSLPTAGFACNNLDFLAHGCTSMVTATFGSGAQFAGALDLHGNTAMTSLSISGATINANLSCQGCSLLATVTLGSAAYNDSGQIISFDSDVLNQASVDAILHRGVISNATTLDFELDSPGNAAPSATGLVDKTTLQLAGNTVNTN